MIVYVRTLLVTGAVFVLANAAWSCVAWLAWPALAARLGRTNPAARARGLFTWRTMPTVVSVVAGLAAGLAFYRFEPAIPGERIGVSLVVLAAMGVAAVVFSAVRFGITLRASERLARAWTAGPSALTVARTGEPAWVIDADFPVVAVVGIRKPRLVLARSVVERCSAGELAAIMAHEGAHVFAHDNLRRLWLRSAVDGFCWTRRAVRVEQAWQIAAEDAADDRAATADSRATDLASALVTVAKLAPGRSLALWPTAACFYRGDGLERRVRRLLGPGLSEPSPGRLPRLPGLHLAVVAAALACLAAGATPLGLSVYVAAEWLVQALP